jgi:ornithine carbamoyltransferase
MIGFSKLGIPLTVCSPQEFSPEKEMIDYCNSLPEADVRVEEDPFKGVKDADIIYTDVWISMGDKDGSSKVKKLKPYQVNTSLLKAAKKTVKVMHCLPAHRDEEIAADVIDGESAIVFDQAENRLHAQKALMAYIYKQ